MEVFLGHDNTLFEEVLINAHATLFWHQHLKGKLLFRVELSGAKNDYFDLLFNKLI